MCTTPPTTERSLGQPAEAVGIQCPLCENASLLSYMKFLDPHGVNRVDPELFECASKRHSYMLSGGELRLLAGDGVRPKTRRLFRRIESGLAEVPEQPIPTK